MPVAGRDRATFELQLGGMPGRPRPGAFGVPPGLGGPAGAGGAVTAPKPVDAFAREQAAKAASGKPGEGVGQTRGAVQDKLLDDAIKQLPPAQRNAAYAEALKKVQDETKSLKEAEKNYRGGQLRRNQEGKLGVDLAEASNNLRGQSRLSITANQQAYGRNCVEIGGVWIDDQFKADTGAVVVKAQSEAYFRILEKHPKMKDVFRLGNHLVWIAPNGQALVIDARTGQEKLSDEEIAKLFTAPAKK
jgi:Ca-activated chloride channel family protein